MLNAIFGSSTLDMILWILLALVVIGILTIILMKILKKPEQPRIIISIITMCIGMLFLGILVYKINLGLAVDMMEKSNLSKSSQIQASEFVSQNSQ